MRTRETVIPDVGVDEEDGDDVAGGGDVFSQVVGERGWGGGGRGVEVVEQAVGVGDVDVEGAVIVSAAEGGEEDVEPAVGVVPVHFVIGYGEVGVYTMRKAIYRGGSFCDEGFGLFSKYEQTRRR